MRRERELEQLAMNLKDGNVKILNQAYQMGYSDGWDDAAEMVSNELNKPDYYDDPFNTEKQKGQRE